MDSNGSDIEDFVIRQWSKWWMGNRSAPDMEAPKNTIVPVLPVINLQLNLKYHNTFVYCWWNICKNTKYKVSTAVQWCSVWVWHSECRWPNPKHQCAFVNLVDQVREWSWSLLAIRWVNLTLSFIQYDGPPLQSKLSYQPHCLGFDSHCSISTWSMKS